MEPIIKRKLWNDYEMEQLNKEYFVNEMDVKTISNIHKRGKSTVYRKIHQLCQMHNVNFNNHSNCNTNCNTNLNDEPNNKQLSPISKMKNKRWLNDEHEQLKREYLNDEIDVKTIAIIHERTEKAIINKFSILKLKNTNKNRYSKKNIYNKRWSENEIELLKREYWHNDIATIAQNHKRTIHAIQNKISELRKINSDDFLKKKNSVYKKLCMLKEIAV